ncbi:MAG: tetratricopeptide repeat protein [Hydrocarboniphaga sp.]|nr:tetratricopeptide repeat protein [Hydrocarboniphaga sp.]
MCSLCHVQWALAYIAASFGLIQILDLIGQRFGWPVEIVRVLIIAVAVGFFVTLVLAWYHGERGAQRITTTEMLILAALLAAGGVLAWRLALPTATSVAIANSTRVPDDKSIAVLAFADLSPGHDQEYFSDGLSEELINSLGRAGTFKVMGRTSSFQFKNSKDDPRTIGQKLGVGYLVDGSVRKASDRVRIGVALVRADDGSNLWSDTYDRDLKDIFAVQTEIAIAVTGQLQHSLGMATTQTLVAKPGDGRPPSGNIEAYQALLQGNFHSRRADAADEVKAMEFYERAIALDPRYALAHAQLAISGLWYAGTYSNDSGVEREVTMARVRLAVATAMALEPDLARAHFALAQLRRIDLQFADAEREFARAAELAPNDAGVIRQLGLMQSERGNIGGALATIDRAVALDPLSRDALFSRGLLLDLIGRFDEAEAALRKAIEIEPQAAANHSQLAITKIHQGDTSAAIAVARQETDPFWRRWALAMALFAHGDRKQADAELEALIRDNGADSPFQISEVYAARKSPDDAFSWLDRALAAKDPGVNQLFTSSPLAAYRNDPRYAAIARKAGLDPANAPALEQKKHGSVAPAHGKRKRRGHLDPSGASRPSVARIMSLQIRRHEGIRCCC